MTPYTVLNILEQGLNNPKQRLRRKSVAHMQSSIMRELYVVTYASHRYA